jgi:hypothetical protein
MQRFLLVAFAACGLFACSESKYDILQKAQAAETKQQLEAALGAPDDVSKLGPIETWTYEASDGSVEFLITGNKVALETTSGKKEAERDD